MSSPRSRRSNSSSISVFADHQRRAERDAVAEHRARDQAFFLDELAYCCRGRFRQLEALSSFFCRRRSRCRRSGRRLSLRRQADVRPVSASRARKRGATSAHMADNVAFLINLDGLQRHGRSDRMTGIGVAMSERADAPDSSSIASQSPAKSSRPKSADRPTTVPWRCVIVAGWKPRSRSRTSCPCGRSPYHFVVDQRNVVALSVLCRWRRNNLPVAGSRRPRPGSARRSSRQSSRHLPSRSALRDCRPAAAENSARSRRAPHRDNSADIRRSGRNRAAGRSSCDWRAGWSGLPLRCVTP